MSSKPSQVRTIDPFAEYNSNVANRFTRIVTGGVNALHSVNSLRLSLVDATSVTSVVVSTGTVVKDDVLIQVTAEHIVEFTDRDNYINFSTGFDEVGHYYVVLEYTYVKSRPAPEVRIKILKPSQRTVPLAGSLLLLGVVNVKHSGGSPPHSIDQNDPFADYDTDNPTNRREYFKYYAGTETNLPTHDRTRDRSRIAYDSVTDEFWLGYEDRWERINAGSLINIDTTAVTVGDLCYVDSNGEAQRAIRSTVATRAEFVALQVGSVADGSGQGRTFGVVSGVPVQAAIVMAVGDVCYLSATEAGTVTNVKPTQGYQNVGKCLAVNGSTIDLLFIPGDYLNQAQIVTHTITAPADWTLSGGNYYSDVDISLIGTRNAIVGVRDTADNMVISPLDLEFTSTSNLRVWMPVNTQTLAVTVVG